MRKQSIFKENEWRRLFLFILVILYFIKFFCGFFGPCQDHFCKKKMLVFVFVILILATRG